MFSISEIRGSRNGSRAFGRFFGSMWLGTKPTTYTSSVALLFSLYMFAIETSKVPVKTV